MLFHEMTANDFRRLGRSLEAHYSLTEITLLPRQLPGKTYGEIDEIIGKMNPSLLPTDYRPEFARSIIVHACRNVL